MNKLSKLKYLVLLLSIVLNTANAQVSAQKVEINKQIDWKLIVNLPNFSYAGYGYGEKTSQS